MTSTCLTRPAVLLGLPVVLLMACAGAVPASAANGGTARAQTRPNPGPVGHVVHPAPIEAALNLLRWSGDDVPLIQVVEVRPRQVNVLAEGWIDYNPDGSARPTIHIAAWSKLYRAAVADRDRRDPHSVIRLAGVLAHERAHLRHGPDEERAYAEQLTTLEHLQATDIETTNVRRALEAVTRR